MGAQRKKQGEIEKVSYQPCAKPGGRLGRGSPELLCQLLAPRASLSLGLKGRVTQVTPKSPLAALEKEAEQEQGEGVNAEFKAKQG